MNKIKTILLVSYILTISGCGSIGGIFYGSDNDKPRLEGERISVLQLQKSLTVDEGAIEKDPLIIPAAWKNASWPQAGGYPNHSMQNLSFPNTSLKKVWSTSIGRGSTDEIPLTASPIAAQGMVFTLDTKSRISAFNAETGKRIWHVSVEKEDEDDSVISGGISYAHQTLYVTNGYDEALAINPENGETIWRTNLPAPSRAAPTIIGGRVFISTIDSRLVTLHAKDGSSLWEYKGIGETTGLLGAASPGANSDIAVPVFSSGEVTALRVENGSVAWSDNLANVKRYGGGLESLLDIKAMPVIDRGIIFAMSFGGKLAAIDERTGTRIWQKEISGTQTPWVAGNYIFVLSSENQLIALNTKDGAVYWITELPRFEDKDKEDPIIWTGPVMGSDKLYLAGSNDKLIEINARNGEVTRDIKTKRNVQLSPIIANETLYLLSESGTLIAYR